MDYKVEKGFVTVATGERYVKMAVNMVKSYRLNTKNQLPFCLITDAEYEYNSLFDDIVILSESRHNTLDKIEIAKYSPYLKNVFIEPDILVYGDANVFFDVFDNADAFSVIGDTFDLSENRGWFNKSTVGKYSDKISFTVGFHGGVYYVDNNKRETLDKFYKTTWEVVENNNDLQFWGKISEDNNAPWGFGVIPPNDETIISLAMALNDCKTVVPQDVNSTYINKYICIYPCSVKLKRKYKCNILKQQLDFYINGEHLKNVCLFHFGNLFTESFCYQREVYRLDKVTYKTNSLSFCRLILLFIKEKPRSIASFVKHRIFML